jgi:hypothetical protein
MNEADLAGVPSLLDHGGRRVAPWGAVYDDDGDDPYEVRRSLARLRHARCEGDDARAAWLLCERAVLAVNQLLRRAPILARRVGPEGQAGPLEVAPVLGGGGLGIEGRYAAWMFVHHGYPWRLEPNEHERMRRRFARLPRTPVVDVPADLLPLRQFIDVADDFEQFVERCQDGAGIAVRMDVFRALSANGRLDGKLPYDPRVKEPTDLPDYQLGTEREFI